MCPGVNYNITKTMQALSHYSYHFSDGQRLVCDLQGGYYGDYYILTDPIKAALAYPEYSTASRIEFVNEGCFVGWLPAACQACGARCCEWKLHSNESNQGGSDQSGLGSGWQCPRCGGLALSAGLSICLHVSLTVIHPMTKVLNSDFYSPRT